MAIDQNALTAALQGGYLRSAARILGVKHPGQVTTKDLVDLCNVAIKSETSGIQLAKTINRKYGWQHETKTEFDPFAEIAPGPILPPLPAPVQPAPDTAAVRAMITELVERGMLKPLQDAIGKMDGDLRKEMEALKAEMPDEENLLSRIEAVADRLIKQRMPTDLVVTMPGEAPKPLGLAHHRTADIIKAVAAGVNVYLHGPAGSGKTTAAQNTAEALLVPFYFAAKVESEYLLLGFKDARGETVRTQFREAYEHGGLFLFDEMDASSPAAIVALNAALANGVCPFPDGTIKRHANFHCIGAGNTTLNGANRQYVGRTQMDAASIDRFAFIEFGYDEVLELELASNKDWCRTVQGYRHAVAERQLPHLITPRATYDGCKLLAAGFDQDTVEGMCVFKGLDADTVKQIKDAARKSEVNPISDAQKTRIARDEIAKVQTRIKPGFEISIDEFRNLKEVEKILRDKRIGK